MCWADVQSALGRGAPRDFLRSLLALPPSERHPAVTEHLPQLQQQGEAFLLECLTEVAAMQEPENLAGLLSGQLGSLNLTAQWRPEAAEVASRLWRASNRSRMAALRLLQSWEVREEDAEEALLALGREALGSQVWEHQALYLQSFPNLGRRLNVTAQKVIDDLCSAGQNKLAKAMTEKCLSGHEKKKVLGRLRLARIKAAAVSEGGEIDGIVAVGRNPKLQAVLIRELWKAGKRGLAEERQKAWKLNLKDLKKSGLKRAHQRLGRFQNLPSSVKLHMVSLQDLEDLTRRMRWWKVVGLDTEASNSKGLSLLQVATWKDVYLLDMTRKSPEMTRFVERLLAAPNISKLAFGGSDGAEAEG